MLGALAVLALVLILRFGLRKKMQLGLDCNSSARRTHRGRPQRAFREVRRFTETAPLLETVARRVAETLHINQVAMLLRRRENFQLQQAIGVTIDGAVTLPAQASPVRYLAATNEPARLYREDPDAWYLMAGTTERHVLDLVNAELLLPLPGRNRLMGMMALGPKRSRPPTLPPISVFCIPSPPRPG